MMFVKLIIVTDENECCNAVISPDLVSSVVFCSAALRCFFCHILASLMKALSLWLMVWSLISIWLWSSLFSGPRGMTGTRHALVKMGLHISSHFTSAPDWRSRRGAQNPASIHHLRRKLLPFLIRIRRGLLHSILTLTGAFSLKNSVWHYFSDSDSFIVSFISVPSL